MTESIYIRSEHADLRREISRFVAREVEPNALAWDEQGFTPREVLHRIGALGWLGLRVAPEYGGAGADAITNVVFQEALARSTSGGFVITVLVHTDMASPHLSNAGNAEQKAQWLPKIAAGECITAVAITEPDAGSDVAPIRTRAVRPGEHWRVNGAKKVITKRLPSGLYFCPGAP